MTDGWQALVIAELVELSKIVAEEQLVEPHWFALDDETIQALKDGKVIVTHIGKGVLIASQETYQLATGETIPND